MNKGAFEKKYYSAAEEDGNSLLEQKKCWHMNIKKIIPPAYRKRIKYWSLEEWRDYQITDGQEKNQRILAELLAEVVKGKIDKSYFTYEENEQLKYLGSVFHMFDITSRSLNNVYNVLQELYEQNKWELL